MHGVSVFCCLSPGTLVDGVLGTIIQLGQSVIAHTVLPPLLLPSFLWWVLENAFTQGQAPGLTTRIPLPISGPLPEGLHTVQTAILPPVVPFFRTCLYAAPTLPTPI